MLFCGIVKHIDKTKVQTKRDSDNIKKKWFFHIAVKTIHKINVAGIA